MTDQELDSLMRRVLMDAIRKDEEDAIDITDPFIPSRKHQRQMKEMLLDPLKWMRNKTKPVWKKFAQRIAVVLLIASVSLGGVMAVSPTVRAAVIRWVTEWYETHITYRYNGDDIDTEMPQYGIGDLPNGYFEIERSLFSSTASVIYGNNLDDKVYFDYAYMQQGTFTALAPRDDVVVEVEINGMEGQLFLPDNPDSAKTVTWIDIEANIQFVINAFCDKDDILHMARSVALVKNTNF